MSSKQGRHRRRRRQVVSGTAVALAAVTGLVLALTIPGTASAAGFAAAYSRTVDWETGYSAQYRVTNTTGSARGFTLEFDLPAGARLTSLWNAGHRVEGRHVTVTPPSWQPELAPGATVDVGFVVSQPGGVSDPTGCRIDGSPCAPAGGDGPAPSSTPPSATTSAPPSAPATSGPTGPVTTPSGPAATTAPPASTPPGGGSDRFAPYIDTSLYPPFDLVSAARATGVRTYTLAFVLAGGGGCDPRWGGVSELGQDGVPGQIGRLRELGGDVRVSFGGANGTELAHACASPAALAAAYGEVISTYGLTRVDFDIEGSSLPDTAANDRRAQAIAQLQRAAAAQGRELDVSFTLPVLPSELTQPGVALLENARERGVRVDAVNVMAMDYGDGAAPNPEGRMGAYAIDAVTATQAQVKGVFGLSDAEAWSRLAVTPMIGVNDVRTEVFRPSDARQVAAFAVAHDLAWWSMWSLTRDQPCPGGPADYAQPTCSSLAQQPLEFTRIFAAGSTG
ncbi:cellulose binding domain-containing protein [Frankia sp. CNm7]|uniref:chitinase n=1 Tax=Frankia nepalensis TaxID=1836974 RepID=A0A937UPH0_9ACTN|nr:cellulose binding domain-containing protein [Frankia nepalensis]MBL7498088.1 cellulose binding domain-containing protein [Frankia nepalensis]MBL7509296.1 cellulose binding domain-containing protein [Frankia nepalensis]MBL7521939.1 cellulose binding domain-containing protein [Frankia nepalensis]MBL7629072.1 cellulose binding domain-containing protein [Frankia nepalensis]